MQFFPHAEGYVKRNTNNTYIYVYQYKDHLGNIRLSYADVNGNGTIQPASEILEENNYYPFGLKHKGYNEIVNSNRSEAAEKYKFGGKELNDELGLDLYDFGARNYDAAIGRWLNVDPLAENSRRWTPYNYAYNNPIFFVDPDGMQSESIIIRGAKESYTYNEETKYRGNDKFIKAALQAIQTLQASQTGSAMIEELDHSNNDFYIESGTEDEFKAKSAAMADINTSNKLKDNLIEKNGIGSGGTITWTEEGMRIPTTTGDNTSAEIILGHEMAHALDANRGKSDRTINETSKKVGENFSRNEWQAVYRENLIRSELGLPLRTHYGRSLETGTGKYLGPLGTGMLGPNNEIIKPEWYE